MATQIYEADQIIVLDTATDSITRPRMAVESIILRGTGAGIFNITLGNAVLLINLTTTVLTMQIPINRTLNYARLNSGPTGAQMTLLLQQKP
jgi:hypothetical protein